MPMKTLSLDAVRGLMIAAQGLQQCPPSPATKADVRQIIRQMHVLQIDTIHVVARSPLSGAVESPGRLYPALAG